MGDCLTCQLTANRDEGIAPLWDSIVRTSHWDVVHSYNSALPGWLVLVARRHIAAVHEMNSAESAELGTLIQQTSKALEQTVGCIKTYVMQFAEAAEHSHVHFHIVPRMADQPDNYKATNIFNYLLEDTEGRVSEDEMNHLAKQIRTLMLTDGAVEQMESSVE